MKFELNKCYRHNGGEEMKIVGEADTTVYGKSLIGESRYGNLSPVGYLEDNAINWTEIPESEWMKNFNK